MHNYGSHAKNHCLTKWHSSPSLCIQTCFHSQLQVYMWRFIIICSLHTHITTSQVYWAPLGHTYHPNTSLSLTTCSHVIHGPFTTWTTANHQYLPADREFGERWLHLPTLVGDAQTCKQHVGHVSLRYDEHTKHKVFKGDIKLMGISKGKTHVIQYDFHVVPIPAMQQFPLSPALS